MSVPKMHADEVDTDVALVGQLLAAQFPHWSHLPLQPVLVGGTDHAIYRIGDDLAARLPRHASTTGQYDLESRWLPLLAPHLPLAVPEPLAKGLPGEGYPFEWSVYRWLPGEPATSAPVTDLGRAADELAVFVAALQRVDPAGGPAPGARRGEQLATRDGPTRAALAALHGEFDTAAAAAAWETALRAPSFDGPRVWVHADLDARNLLVVDGRLTAVIDFGCLGVGDPAVDLGVAWKLFPAAVRERFRRAFSVDEATWARARGWTLSQSLIALGYYTHETNATLVSESRRWITEVLADQE
jgi:aminoglycoside phosphotransferase (APT) family kinase protein